MRLMSIAEDPYYRVVLVSFYGDKTDRELGYRYPEHDSYLRRIEIEFDEFLFENTKPFNPNGSIYGFSVITKEIAHPGSSGYENSLCYIIGLYSEDSYNKFIEFIKTFPSIKIVR